MSELPKEPTPEEWRAAQKRRNLWLGFALVAFVAIVGVTTAVRIQNTDFSRGDRMYFSGYMNEAAVEKADREAQKRADELNAEAVQKGDDE